MFWLVLSVNRYLAMYDTALEARSDTRIHTAYYIYIKQDVESPSGA